jgi:hypothetical protein
LSGSANQQGSPTIQSVNLDTFLGVDLDGKVVKCAFARGTIYQASHWRGHVGGRLVDFR